LSARKRPERNGHVSPQSTIKGWTDGFIDLFQENNPIIPTGFEPPIYNVWKTADNWTDDFCRLAKSKIAHSPKAAVCTSLE
jgi:hypothetical protein